MEYLVLFLVSVLFLGLIFFIYKRFTTKTYPRITEQLLNNVTDLSEIGLRRNENGFNGHHRKYFISIFATTSIKRVGPNIGERYQIWISVAPESGQLKSIGGFFSRYIVSGETAGFAYVGMIINANTTFDPKKTMMDSINKLIDVLEENNIKPYIVS